MIAACQKLRDRDLNFNCRIVGGGTLKKELQAQIDENGLQDYVELTGSMSQKQVVELYDEADIFALPCVVADDGDRDGIPVVLMEAMAFEIPVVTTPVTGIPDLVRHQETGLLVAERDAEGLTNVLEQLINDRPLRQALGKRGRQIILEKFDIRKNVAQLASIFRQVSGGAVAETPPDDSCNNSTLATTSREISKA